jgi:hypothetical protein
MKCTINVFPKTLILEEDASNGTRATDGKRERDNLFSSKKKERESGLKEIIR